MPQLTRPLKKTGTDAELPIKIGQKIFVANDKIYLVAEVRGKRFLEQEREWEICLVLSPQADLDRLDQDIRWGFKDFNLVASRFNYPCWMVSWTIPTYGLKENLWLWLRGNSWGGQRTTSRN